MQFVLRITDESHLIFNWVLHSLSVNYGSVYKMLLHLKTGDGDLLLITEPSLTDDAHENCMQNIVQPCCEALLSV